MFASKTLAAIAGSAALAAAHMTINTPKPFTGTINSPIDASGSNFPCQGLSPSGFSTSMPLGSNQPLAFTGQAVHGGGSCQISISYDVQPTKSSVWKVVHSIQGGCPAIGQSQNMGSDAAASDPYTFTFPIPSNIPAGNATVAWSWLNRIGNREFYMNCAPVSLTGTGGAKSNYDALPDMLVANIKSVSACTTVEGNDYLYPNPGSSVENHPFSASSLKALPDACGAQVASSSSGSSGSSGSSSGSSASSSAPAGGVFVTVSPAAASASPAAASSAAPAVVSAQPSAAASSGASSSGGSSSSGSSSGSGSSSSSGSGSTVSGAQAVGSACTDGAWACVSGGTAYQRCGSGFWSPVMPLAAGTKCTGASGMNIDIVAANAKVKRMARRFRS